MAEEQGKSLRQKNWQKWTKALVWYTKVGIFDELLCTSFFFVCWTGKRMYHCGDCSLKLTSMYVIYIKQVLFCFIHTVYRCINMYNLCMNFHNYLIDMHCWHEGGWSPGVITTVCSQHVYIYKHKYKCWWKCRFDWHKTAFYIKVTDQHRHCPVKEQKCSIVFHRQDMEAYHFYHEVKLEGSVNWKVYEIKVCIEIIQMISNREI